MDDPLDTVYEPDQSFIDHLERASAAVRTWPKWKQRLIGIVLPEERKTMNIPDVVIRDAVSSLETAASAIDGVAQALQQAQQEQDPVVRRNCVPGKNEPHKPAFKVGQWVVILSTDLVRTVEKVTGQFIMVGGSYYLEDSLRLATPADYQRTVDGVKVRLYKTSFGCLMMTSTGGMSEYHTGHACTSIALAGLLALGIPIIPLSVSGGRFEAPKGE